MWHHSGELYELVIVRDPSIEAYQGIFYTFPDLQNTKTRDLFSKHPSKHNLWRHEGRSDDIIVYSTGEKFNPISMENALNSHPKVRSAIVYGTKKFQSSVLNEPTDPEGSKDVLLDALWPNNKDCKYYLSRACADNEQGLHRIHQTLINHFPELGKVQCNESKPKNYMKQSSIVFMKQVLMDRYSTRKYNEISSLDKGASLTYKVPSLETISNFQGFENFSASENFLSMDWTL
ncbi:uncharacterized protein EAF02_002413 [Botrytis sinoallii]|uniref:uncharacterized protein n=1 Tax=Botrytis sinoallii TaxID=1463999 RepID=UPI0018FFC414|nr:uncharacterized protein EAF02_002413 [Botrytis sinoallii]KAF7889998.1 hypothetical protein EAF02_002413 [Botrytis sinoallii]